MVSGRLQIRDWTDRDGNKRRSAEVVADNVYFGDSKKSRESGDSGAYRAPQESYGRPAAQSTPPQSAPSAFAELDDGDDGDLPF